MSSCKFSLEHNGEYFEFNSKEELSSFISANLNRLSLLEYTNDVKFSKDNALQQEVVAKIKVLSEKNKMDVTYDEFGNKIIKSDGISVTKAINTLKNQDDKPLVAPFDVNAYKEFKMPLLIKEIKASNPNLSSTEIETLANEAFEKLVESWKTLAKLGTGIHLISELYFNNLEMSSEELLKLLKSHPTIKSLNVETAQIQQIIDYVNNIHNKLLEIYPDATFIPEVKLKSETSDPQIVGKIDLLVVDKNAEVHVFDFKTSPSNYYEFNKVKNLSINYQLGLYRQMLAQLGFNPSKIDLGVIPIEMLDIDYENKSFSGISSKVIIDVRSSHLNEDKSLVYGNKISNELNKFLPVRTVFNTVDENLTSTLDKIYEKLFKFSSKYKMAVSTFENFKKKKISKRPDGTFSFFNKLLDKFVSYQTQEQAEQAAEEYLKELTANEIALASEIGKQYSKVEDIEDSNKREFGEHVHNVTFLNKYFRNYLKWGYKLNTSLSPNGILVFYHPQTKAVDFVYINQNNLSSKINLNGRKFITGMIMPDREAPVNTLNATTGNIELMRVMGAINEFMPNLQGFKLQDVKVINYEDHVAAIQTTDVLVENFTNLINGAKRNKLLDITNNFTNGKITTISAEEKIINMIDTIFLSSEIPPSVKKHGENLKTSLNTLKSTEQKISKLIDMLNALQQEGGKTVISPLSGVATENKSYLYYLVADAIRTLNGLKFLHSLSDLDPLSPHSDLWMDSAHSPNQIINETNKKVIENVRISVIERNSKELPKIKHLMNTWMEEKGVIDSSLNSYDHLLDIDENLKILKTKNPYSDPTISQSDKKMLIGWLKIINEIRYPSTNGDHTTIEAKKLIESGEWFNVPLMRGGLINRGISLTSMKNIVKDISDKTVNLLETLANPQMKEIGKQEETFDHYINPMLTDGEGIEGLTMRNNLIAEKGVKYFSKDLAEIALTYVNQYIIADEYENALPVLKTSLICANAMSLFSGADIGGTLKTMMQKTQTTIYKTQHMGPTEKALMRIYGPISALASMVTLPFNTFSFVRELFQGKYNNYGRMLTRYGGKDAPSATTLTKAYMFVLGEGVKSAGYETLMNKFNLRYAIFGRSMQEHKESFRPERNPILGQAFKSGSMYWMNGLSDYYHRMALFLGHIMEGDFMDAYSVDPETDTLKYDFKKDKRFDNLREFFKGGKLKPGDKGLETYNMLLASFNKTLPESEKLSFGDDLPDGLSSEQVISIRNLANLIHGNLDTDTQMHGRNFFAGKVFFKYINFIGAKNTAWSLSGGRYNMYEPEYEVDPETGDPLYIKTVKDENGNVIGTETTTDFNDSTGQKVVKLTEKYEEGVAYAFLDLFKVIFNSENRKENWENLKNDEYKMGSLQFHTADLFLFLIAGIFASLVDWPELKEEDPFAYMNLQALHNTFSENNPISIATTVLNGLDPAALRVGTKLYNNTMRFLTSDNYELKQYVMNTYGFGNVLTFF